MRRPSRVRSRRNWLMMTLELFGMGIAPRHHGGAFGDAQKRLAQLQPAFLG